MLRDFETYSELQNELDRREMIERYNTTRASHCTLALQTTTQGMVAFHYALGRQGRCPNRCP
jgi:hypothetical protein